MPSPPASRSLGLDTNHTMVTVGRPQSTCCMQESERSDGYSVTVTSDCRCAAGSVQLLSVCCCQPIAYPCRRNGRFKYWTGSRITEEDRLNNCDSEAAARADSDHL